jgi:hypothetical protein
MEASNVKLELYRKNRKSETKLKLLKQNYGGQSLAACPARAVRPGLRLVA